MSNFDLMARGCGSTEAQVVNFTQRIREISEHVKANKHDHSAHRGLILLVGKRRRLLNYLKRTNRAIYDDVVKVIKS